MMDSEHEYFSEGKIFHGSVPHVMGTRLEMIFCGAEKAAAETLWENICAEARSLDRMMNRFDPQSEVSRLNAGGGDPSPGMSEMIALCGQFRKSTCGLFDIAYLGDGKLDFGGFGKGFLLKKVKEMLLAGGVTTAYVDFGGSSILALGHHPYGNCWKVGVTDPFSGRLIRELELTDMAMSTSGNQPGYVGHIKDPRDGSPFNGRKMVTILSPDPLTAEIASTAAMLADGEELEYIKENNDIAKIFIHQ